MLVSRNGDGLPFWLDKPVMAIKNEKTSAKRSEGTKVWALFRRTNLWEDYIVCKKELNFSSFLCVYAGNILI